MIRQKAKTDKKRASDTKTEAKDAKKPKTDKPSVVIPPVDESCSVKGKVYCDSENVIHSVVLNQTDIAKNNNKFYKIQLIESGEGAFCVFKSWGRVGYGGQTSLNKFSEIEQAVKDFAKSYRDKTRNVWKSPAPFQKFDGKYHPIEVFAGNEDDEEKVAEALKIPSKLHKRVQDLMKMLFDIDSMKQSMRDHGLDTEKMPLGKLSKKQLLDAYKVLTDLSQLVTYCADEGRLIEASNRFYTLMPHNFGMTRAPVIDCNEVIKKKQEMIDNLMQIEVACKLMKLEDEGEKKNLLDTQYEAMKTELEPLDHESDEFQMIKKFMLNTHAATHSNYALELQDVFKVEREGEKDRFEQFSKLHNRQLLWHGSRKTNFVGILSNGLRIAPKEAPVTGYMFGKGIYFADSCSKSANYCLTSPGNNVGLMLLSEVALGDCHDLTQPKYVEKLPAGKHSVKGVGKTQPNPKEAIKTENDIIVPLGKLKTNNKLQTSLLYNEFIVYDTAQVNLKYLLKVKFVYKR